VKKEWNGLHPRGRKRLLTYSLIYYCWKMLLRKQKDIASENCEDLRILVLIMSGKNMAGIVPKMHYT
jgi:hypothetical protein